LGWGKSLDVTSDSKKKSGIAYHTTKRAGSELEGGMVSRWILTKKGVGLSPDVRIKVGGDLRFLKSPARVVKRNIRD